MVTRKQCPPSFPSLFLAPFWVSVVLRVSFLVLSSCLMSFTNRKINFCWKTCARFCSFTKLSWKVELQKHDSNGLFKNTWDETTTQESGGHWKLREFNTFLKKEIRWSWDRGGSPVQMSSGPALYEWVFPLASPAEPAAKTCCNSIGSPRWGPPGLSKSPNL